MCRDKLLLEVGGAPLVRRVHDALAARCEEILVAGAKPRSALPERARFVPDMRPGEGPLAGIEAGLSAASNPFVFVAAGDMPFVSPELARYLIRISAERSLQAAVPLHEGIHPLCAVYSRDVLPLVSRALDGGTRAVHDFLESLDMVEYIGGEDLRRFGEPDLVLMNVNTPEDLERARAALRDWKK